MTNSPFIVHESKKYFPERMSYDALNTLLASLQSAIETIAQQIAEAHTHGRVNANWLGRASDAKDIKEKQVKLVKRVMRNLKNRRATLPDVFLEVAHDELPRNDFNRIMSIAKNRFQGNHPSRSNGIDEWIG